ncbi:hypothetical protein Tco_0380133, partial [Tanacetum coccineum]
IIQEQNAAADLIDDDTNDLIDERWDDFEKDDIKMALDEVLKCKQTAGLHKSYAMLMNK